MPKVFYSNPQENTMKSHETPIPSVMTSVLRFICFVVLLATTVLSSPVAHASTDYGPAIYREAYPGHWYTTGYGKRFYIIHDMEGYYWGTIYWFQRSTVYA